VPADSNSKQCYKFCISFYKQLKAIVIVIGKIKSDCDLFIYYYSTEGPKATYTVGKSTRSETCNQQNTGK